MLVHEVVPGVHLTKKERICSVLLLAFFSQACECPVGSLDVTLTALTDARPLHQI